MSISLRSKLCPSGDAQVAGDRLLVAGHDRPPQRLAVRLLPAPFAHRVAAARVLDLDDLGAEVAEQLPAERAGQQLAELDHPQVVQRQCCHVVQSVLPPNMLGRKHCRSGVVQVRAHDAVRPVRVADPGRRHHLDVVRQAAGQCRRRVVVEVLVDHRRVGDGEQRRGQRRVGRPVDEAVRWNCRFRCTIPSRSWPRPGFPSASMRVRKIVQVVQVGIGEPRDGQADRVRLQSQPQLEDLFQVLVRPPGHPRAAVRVPDRPAPRRPAGTTPPAPAYGDTSSRVASSASPSLAPAGSAPARISSRSMARRILRGLSHGTPL